MTVKNKTAAPIQITAEQIIGEARQLRLQKHKITVPNLRLQKRDDEDLYRRYLAFQKQFGDKNAIDYAISWRKRFEYEDQVKKNPFNYDSWFDYTRLEESVGNTERIREIYKRAVVNVPPAEEKRYWQRYIYLWINYALFEEIDAGDIERTRNVYKECLNLIPHHKFTFSKIWLLAAQFEIRQSNLKGARRILGNAIGKAPKDKIFKKYIEMELQLGNVDRCRRLYEKYLEWSPQKCYAWIEYAELERSLSETWRARAIFDIAIGQPALDLDMPELLWKAYIDFEVAECEFEKARVLHRRLLEFNYIFPEETQRSNLKILEAAYRWKKQKLSSEF
ncbi:crooked neck 1-like protein [Trifolium pratense]|uniref:Crooked neck 1-like protein n=1 Tax=Trifolium pratense TaxID=57577 RepID=A0A2K3MCG9_TRIPR|nr:crooked neck 1-like protein [Trifolium pratense]